MSVGASADWTDAAGVVHSAIDRQITNVAAGTDDTDAVNVAQLNQALATSSGNLGGSMSAIGEGMAQILGGGASYGVNGFTPPAYLIQGTSYGNVGDALSALDGAMTNAVSSINSLGNRVNQLTGGPAMGDGNGLAIGQGSVATDGRDTAVGNGAVIGADGSTALGNNATIAAAATNAVAVGADSNVTAASGTAVGQAASVTAANSVALGANSVADRANTVSVGSVGAERQITNVAAGTAATDAANVGQVNEALATAKTYADAGDVTTLNSAKAYTDSKLTNTVSTSDFNAFRDQVNDQFHSVNTRLNRVGAMGSAMAGMAGAIAAAPGTDNRVSAAVGNYSGQGALAVGYARHLPGNGAVIVGGTIAGGGESSGTVGVSFGW